MKCAQDNVTLLFFPDFSPATTTRGKRFSPVLKKMTSLGLQPFLTYPAVIKLRHKGEQRMFDSLSQKKTYAAALQSNGKTAATISPAGGGRGLVAGVEAVPAAQEGMMQGGHGCCGITNL